MAAKFAILFLFLGTIATAIYLAVRLDLFSLRNRRGLGTFLFGLGMVVVALVWQVMTLSSTYADWFVPSAYAAANIIQALVAAAGVFLCGAGIVAHDRYWHDERRAVLRREQMLSMLENLQHDARQPHQLIELLNISLREMLSPLPGASGAIFFTNRTQRQFVLTASFGLSKEEVAALEHYPLDRNVVSQSLHSAEPLVAPGFDFVQSDGSVQTSRFRSAMVLPLVAAMEQIGAVVLVSTAAHRFDRDDIRVLTPITEWLAERVRATRLSRELTSTRAERDRLTAQLQALHERVGAAVSSLDAPDPLGAFGRALVGLFESTSVHFTVARGGKLEFQSHSHPLGELSQSYQIALTEAIGRGKPLLINQESTDESGRDRIVASTLVVPLGETRPNRALILRREAGQITVGDPSMQTVDLVSRLAALAVEFVEVRHRTLSQRTGFDRIMRMLDPATFAGTVDPEWLVEELLPAFPPSTGFLVLAEGSDALHRAVYASRINEALVSALAISRREGAIGTLQFGHGTKVLAGKNEIEHWLTNFAPSNRATLDQLFGRDLQHTIVAICPLDTEGDRHTLLVIIKGVAGDAGREEYARLLTLACALYRLRAVLGGRGQGSIANVESTAPPRQLAQEGNSVSETISGQIEAMLSRARISGDLYMFGGRPREIRADISTESGAKTGHRSLPKLVEAALTELAAISGEDEMITLSSYEDKEFVFFDFSRHGRHFPAIRQVVGFGQYHPPTTATNHVAKTILAQAGEDDLLCASDSTEGAPSYLSFKIPKRKSHAPNSNLSPNRTNCVLVIDDQQVILDLVSAMCQTIGFAADCAISGEIGLQLVARKPYAAVLVDLAMPGLSGIDVARIVHRQYPELPIVIMTGWEATVDQSAMSQAGVVEILYKPFRIEQLGDLLKSLVGTARQS